MKTLLALALLLMTLTARAGVGPDLAAGTDRQYFTQLRYATAQKKDYPPAWKADPDRKKINAAYRSGDTAAVLQLADAWLQRLPIDADVHLMVAMCYKEKGDLPNMCQHLNAFYGLLASITASGDGLTPQTAFKVVSRDEESSLIQEIDGHVTSQKLSGNIDQLKVERRSGKSLTLYFDVSAHLKAPGKSLDAK
jgi:hypothetical protein